MFTPEQLKEPKLFWVFLLNKQEFFCSMLPDLFLVHNMAKYKNMANNSESNSNKFYITPNATFILKQATGDPYYLEVGKTLIENLNKYARVPCGFAAMKDVRTGSHEDR